MAYMKDLATRIDDFTYDFDPYEYADSFDARGDAIPSIEDLIENDPATLAAHIRDMAEATYDEAERASALGLADEIETVASAQRTQAGTPKQAPQPAQARSGYVRARDASTLDKLKIEGGETWQRLELARAGIGLDALVHDASVDVVAECARCGAIQDQLATSAAIVRRSLSSTHAPAVREMARTELLYPDVDDPKERTRGMCILRIGDALEGGTTMPVLVSTSEGADATLRAYRLEVDPDKVTHIDHTDPITHATLPATVVAPTIDASGRVTLRTSDGAETKMDAYDLFEGCARASQTCLDCISQNRLDELARQGRDMSLGQEAPTRRPIREKSEILAAMPDDEFATYGP